MIRRAAFHRFLVDRRGAVAIEFAAIALPFILLLAGTMEISRYTWTRVALQDAASAGARCLGLGPRPTSPCFDGDSMDTSKTQSLVRQQALAWGVSISQNTVTPKERDDCNGIPDFGMVEIEHLFSSVLPALPDSSILVQACFPRAQPG